MTKQPQSYDKYENLIRKIAWRWAKRTGHEIDDLIAEGNLIFMDCQKSWNPEKGAFSTHLTNHLTGKLRNYLFEHKSVRTEELNEEIDLSNLAIDYQENPERKALLKTMIDNLSKDARSIIETILNAPKELTDMAIAEVYAPRPSKNRLARFLKRNGMTFYRSDKCFEEIKEALKAFN